LGRSVVRAEKNTHPAQFVWELGVQYKMDNSPFWKKWESKGESTYS
jgi:hypothetical protein